MLFSFLFICAVSAKFSLRCRLQRRARCTIFPDRLLPGFLHLPQLAGSCLVIRFFAVLIFGVVDFFLASARRCVVRIETQDLIVSFHRQVVLAGLVIAVGFGEQFVSLSPPAQGMAALAFPHSQLLRADSRHVLLK